MKLYSTLLYLTVMGVMVPGLYAMDSNRKPKKSESVFTSGKVLGALGLAGGAGAYYAYTHPAEAKAKYEEAKTKLGAWKDAATAYAQNPDNSRTLIWGAVGGAAALYIGYKMFIQAQEPELAVESPDADQFLKTLGTAKKPGAAARKSSADIKQFPSWYKQAGDLIEESFSHIKNEDSRHEAMKPYIQRAAKDPHQLMRGERFIGSLSDDQRLQLMGIFVEFTQDRVAQAAQTLLASLSDDQDGVKEMLSEALEYGDAATILGLLHMFVEEKQISGEQAKFVQSEIAFIKGCADVQKHFVDWYKLDEVMAHKHGQAAKKPAPRKNVGRK